MITGVVKEETCVCLVLTRAGLEGVELFVLDGAELDSAPPLLD